MPDHPLSDYRKGVQDNLLYGECPVK